MRRWLCMVLAASMVLSMALPPARGADAAAPLEASRLDPSALPEGELLYMGTASAALPEEERAYTFPIYREGDLSGAASVELRTLDLTAVYGEDYELLEKGVQRTGDGVSMLERYVTAALEAPAEGIAEPEETPEPEKTVAPEENVSSPSSAEEGPLQALKEAQTGLPTREIAPESSDEEMSREEYQRMVDEMVPMAMSAVEYSSSTTVTFAPGEDVKWIEFKILDDDKSEGDEGFSLLLVDPAGAELYQVTSLSVTIQDDEPAEKSVVSFSQASYTSQDGVAAVKLQRTGGEYTLCDFMLLSVGETAVAGINYEAVSQAVAFMPYETEKEIEIPVTGSGSFQLLLRDLSGCEAGEIDEAVVTIAPSARNALGAPSATALTASGEQSFEIAIDGQTYVVKYTMPGSGKLPATGKIYLKGNYDSAPEVGVYYFSTDTGHGGIFSYGYKSGSKPWGCGKWHSDYQMGNASTMDASNYGRLDYYHTTCWKKGQVYTVSSAIPTACYQLLAPDWESTSGFGGGQDAYFVAGSLKAEKTGKFDRTQNAAKIKLLDSGGKALTGNVTLEVHSRDDSKSKTPKTYVRFYGVAALYKKYQVTVAEADEMSFRVGSSAVKAKPLQVRLQSGAEVKGSNYREFWSSADANGTNIVLTIDDAAINGRSGKFGTVTGYTIAIDPGTAEKKVTLNYPDDFVSYLNKMKGQKLSEEVNFTSANVDREIKKVNSNLAVIPMDPYFAAWIESAQKAVVDSGGGYYQKLTILPKVTYAEVKVEVLPAVSTGEGHFTDNTLSTEGVKTYHAGDTLDLSVTSDTADGIVMGYEVSTDGGAHFNTITDTKELFLEPRYTSYKVRPVVDANTNKIEIQFLNTAQGHITVQGLVTSTDLDQCTDEKLVQELKDKRILKVNPEGATLREQITPIAGEVYAINFIEWGEDSKYLYRPVITRPNDTNAYKTNCYYFLGAANAADNVITVGCESVEKSKLSTFDVTGALVSSYYPIRDTGAGGTTLPMVDYTVTAGKGTQSGSASTGHVADRATDMTASDGTYVLRGISGLDGDKITLCISNGVFTDTVKTVTLTTAAGAAGGVYPVKAGNTELAYPYGAPKVTSVMYRYGTHTDQDTTLNQIRILDDTLTLTATVDRCGRDVQKAIFTVKTITGNTKQYEAFPTTDGTGNIATYECKIEQMGKYLYSGDSVSVRLVDAEKKPIYSTTTLTDGTEVREKVNEADMVYPDVDTGLTFYTASDYVAPKNFQFTTTPKIDIPLIGSAIGQANSGTLSFGRTDWDNDTGYTIQVNVDATVFGGSAASKSPSEKWQAYQNLHATAKSPGTSENYVNAMNVLNSFATSGGAPKQTDYSSEEEYKAANARWTQALRDAENPTAGFNSDKMSLEVAFVMAFDFVNTPNGYVFSCGTVAVGGAFNYQKTMYTVVSSVPVFLNIQAGLQANAVVSYVTDGGKNIVTANEFSTWEGNIAKRLSADTECKINVVLSGKVQVGAGLCGVLSARGYVALTFQFDIYCSDGSGGALITAVGGVGFDLLVMSLNIDIAKYTKGWGTLEYADEGDFFNGLIQKGGSKALALDPGQGDGGASVAAQDYGTGSAATLASFGKNNTLQAVPAPVRYTILQEDAAERTRPHIIPLDEKGDKKLITFIGNGTALNSGSRNETNAETLFYSVYQNGSWCTPQPIADDATVDSSPTMKKVGDKVVIAWADASAAHADSDATAAKLGTFGISCAVYDITNGAMGNEIQLVQDQYFDLAPQINAVGDTVYISYLKRDLTQLTSGNDADLVDFTKSYSTMAYVTLDLNNVSAPGQETFIPIFHETLTDPLVTDYTAVTRQFGANSYLISTYTVDRDKDQTSGEDRELYLGLYNLTNDTTYFPIRLDNNEVAESVPKLTEVDDTIYLTWLEDGYKFNILDVSEVITAMFAPEAETAKDETGSDVNLFTANTVSSAYTGSGMEFTTGADGKKTVTNANRDWYKKTATQLSMDENHYNDSIYAELANGSFRVTAANFRGNDSLRAGISDYIVTSNGDDVYIYYTQMSQAQDDNGVELYGVRWKRGDSEGTAADASAPEATTSVEDVVTEVTEEDKGLKESAAWGFGKAVQITDFGKVLDEVDLFMTADNKVCAVSNFYEQWTDAADAERPIKYSGNSLAECDFEPVSSLTIVDQNIIFPANIYPGSFEEISFTVENGGLLDAKGYTVTLKDGAGTTLYTETVNQMIEAGGRKESAILWQAPEDLSASTALTVEITELGVENPKAVTATETVPYETWLELGDVSVEQGEDGYLVTARLKNNGAKTSSPGTVTLSSTGDRGRTFDTVAVPALTGGQSTPVELTFDPDTSDFSSLGRIDLSLLASAGADTADTTTTFVSPEPLFVTINDGAERITLKGASDRVKLVSTATPWDDHAGQAQYYSSDNGVAIVDDEGSVIPTGDGTATLYAYYPLYGITGEIEVSVSGMTETPTPTPSPSYHDNNDDDDDRDRDRDDRDPSDKQKEDPGEIVPPVTPGDGGGSRFDDVPPEEWYYSAVNTVSEKGLMVGVSDTDFAPNMTLTRGMLATVLYRMADEPEARGQHTFLDVPTDAYFAKAIAWASENEIVNGYTDAIFAPGDTITREQLATMLYRYVGNPETAGTLEEYIDADAVSGFAEQAMRWAVEQGILHGYEDRSLRPQGSATRAEVAAVLTRFLVKQVE